MANHMLDDGKVTSERTSLSSEVTRSAILTRSTAVVWRAEALLDGRSHGRVLDEVLHGDFQCNRREASLSGRVGIGSADEDPSDVLQSNQHVLTGRRKAGRKDKVPFVDLYAHAERDGRSGRLVGKVIQGEITSDEDDIRSAHSVASRARNIDDGVVEVPAVGGQLVAKIRQRRGKVE